MKRFIVRDCPIQLQKLKSPMMCLPVEAQEISGVFLVQAQRPENQGHYGVSPSPSLKA